MFPGCFDGSVMSKIAKISAWRTRARGQTKTRRRNYCKRSWDNYKSMKIDDAFSQMMMMMQRPLGCDTFVAFPPVAPPSTVIFGKNSDRPHGEGQSIRRYPRSDAAISSSGSMVDCTYLQIPQATNTHAVLLSQIDWMWGVEMGANECGVVIGNEAVWTVEEDETLSSSSKPCLLGMDLVRLGLERGSTSKEALDTITTLLETHGQGGACAENDPSFTYHNSFLIADCSEAYVLETAGRHWVAERITSGVRNISNGLTIRTNFNLHSKGLHDYAKERRLWNGTGKLGWAQCFSDGGVDNSLSSRQHQGSCLLKEHKNGTLDAQAMMNILRDHDSGICMHGSFETTASMVSELRPGGAARHWMTGKPHPCKASFELQSFVD